MTVFSSRLALGLVLALSVTSVAEAQSSRNSASRGAPRAQPISFGQTVQGRVSGSATEETCTQDAPNVRRYSFQGQADSRFEITMTSDDFDTVLEIGRLDGCRFVSLGRNDDGSGPEDGLNSRLTGRLPTTGTYIVRASSFGTDSSGPFELKLTQLPPIAQAGPPRPLQFNTPVEGSLSAGDPIIVDTARNAAAATHVHGEGEEAPAQDITETGRHYQMYALQGRAGQEFLIKLDSDEFDPVLDVGVNSPLGYSVAATNDDGPGTDDGLNSRLKVKFQEDGTLWVRVSPYSSGAGAYTLVVVDPEEDARAAAAKPDAATDASTEEATSTEAATPAARTEAAADAAAAASAAAAAATDAAAEAEDATTTTVETTEPK